MLVGICSLHILLRRHRQPESRLAWLTILFALPFAGALAYLLLGTTNIGRTSIVKLRDVSPLLSLPPDEPMGEEPTRTSPLFRVEASISGYLPTGGNQAELMGDSDTTIRRIIDDINQASHSAHLLFYIWLADHDGTAVASALARAAQRGVARRAIIDDIGSRDFIHSALWTALASAGVKLVRALPVGKSADPSLQRAHRSSQSPQDRRDRQ